VGQLAWFGSLLLIAALLPPKSFGSVAVAMVMVQVAWLIVGSGTRGSFITSGSPLTRAQIERTVAQNTACGLAIGLAIAALAGPLVSVLSPGADVDAMRALALSICLYGLSIVPLALLQRAMRFRLHASVNAGAALLASALAVLAAVAGLGVWALVLRQLLFQGLLGALAWAAARRLVPAAAADAPPARREPVAWWFFVLSVVAFLAYNVDYVLVGRLTDVTQVGLYALAFSIAFAPVTQVAWQVGKVLFASTARADDPAAVAARAARAAGVISGVGYNYRWAPLVRYAKQLIDAGELGEITNYRGRFFSMYGSDPLGLLSWRFKLDEGGYGVTSDLLSHAVDLAHMLIGPITRVVGTTATFIAERPLPVPGQGTHYGRGAAGDRTGPVTNEDYAGMLCEFANGVRGTFEASRTIVGPESQMAFDVHGTRGAVGWNLEKLNELQLYRLTDDPGSGYTTVYGGERFPYHGHFVPGSANGIGFEDLVVIEDYEFCRSVVEGRTHSPGFEDALAWVNVQAALLRSVESGRWEDVG
jgi:predicted dehydrogenase